MKYSAIYFDSIQSTAAYLLAGVFKYPIDRKGQWANRAWLLGLFLTGLFVWGNFFNWGRVPLNYEDWAIISAPRFDFLKDAVTRGLLPLHISNPDPLDGITTRYMAVPDAFLSPQAVLLRFMDVGHFVLVDMFLMYSLGFLGLLWFRRKFSLSPAAFTILFLLFNFNGHILSHLSVGHETWGGYFLYPLFAIVIFQLIDGERSWNWAARGAFLLFFIFLQGSFHQFVWMLLLIGLLAITKKMYFWPGIKLGAFSILLSMVRILPPSILLNTFNNAYLGGYPSLIEIWKSMVTISVPGRTISFPFMVRPLGTWEFDLYVGLIGALFLVYFGIFRWLRSGEEGCKYHKLLLPILILTFLSIGKVFSYVRLLSIPLLAGERVSSRIISLPFFFLLLFGAIQFQRWVDKNHKFRSSQYLAVLGVLLVEAYELWNYVKIWRVLNVSSGFPLQLYKFNFYVVNNNYGDLPYLRQIEIGAVVSAISMLVLLGLVWLEKIRASKSTARYSTVE
jgi:hypothetical protein